MTQVITAIEGFIVHAFHRNEKGRTRLFLVGRSSDGKTFALVESRIRPSFYIRNSDLDPAERLAAGAEVEQAGLTAMDGESCSGLSFKSLPEMREAGRLLEAHGIRTYEADLRLEDQFLLSRKIHGSLKIEGPWRRGRYVDRIFLDPEVWPSDWVPSLSILAIDIETDPSGRKIFTVAMVHSDPFSGKRIEEVFLSGQAREDEFIKSYPDEKSMLLAFSRRVCELDPDIITGWNIIDFDLRIILERMGNLKLPFILGRSSEPAVFLAGSRARGRSESGRSEKKKSDHIIIPGREILDGLRLARAAPEHYPDYSLETVAQSVLGYGKILEENPDESKVEAIVRLYRDDPAKLCEYCLRDAGLVIDILERTGLINLTVRRCLLIGIALNRAWTSIAAFDFIYIEAMHRRKIVAPTLGVDQEPPTGAPGGAILKPRPGVYQNVIVFDFKSLYPSIIRTFNIDPVGRRRPSFDAADHQRGTEDAEGAIRAPNGAEFSRGPAILPEILERFFTNRDIAKQRGDKVASYVFKIIMNSFYGVLGASGSRFAASELAGAITSFGHHLLSWCESYLKERGFEVLYGDTDSLFVLAGLAPESGTQAVWDLAGSLSTSLNRELAEYIGREYRVTSLLELEIDKIYSNFFLPPVRGLGRVVDRDNGRPDRFRTPARGRAKGYAGIRLPVPEEGEDGEAKSHESADTRAGEERAVEVTGLEAVRRDWTELAKEFQIRMLEMLFRGDGLDAIRTYIGDVVRDLLAARLDQKLIYVKSLRKPIAAYNRSRPPHVKAAALLEPEERQGLIRFIWTREGPQPVGRLTAPIDYEHYVEKQLKPIASGFTDVLHVDLEDLFDQNRQLRLF